MEYYYRRVKELREERGTKQSDLAKFLEITQPQYHLYESGKREIPFHVMIKLADYYHVSLDYLAERDSDNSTIDCTS